MISQHWFRKWLGAIRQQAITWANVDPDLCRHVVSLGHNELMPFNGWLLHHTKLNPIVEKYTWLMVEDVITVIHPQCQTCVHKFHLVQWHMKPCMLPTARLHAQTVYNSNTFAQITIQNRALSMPGCICDYNVHSISYPSTEMYC